MLEYRGKQIRNAVSPDISVQMCVIWHSLRANQWVKVSVLQPTVIVKP